MYKVLLSTRLNSVRFEKQLVQNRFHFILLVPFDHSVDYK